MKIKESDWLDKYLDFSWIPKKLWNMKVMMIPFTIKSLGTVPKYLGKRLD